MREGAADECGVIGRSSQSPAVWAGATHAPHDAGLVGKPVSHEGFGTPCLGLGHQTVEAAHADP